MKFNLKFGQPQKQAVNYEMAPAFSLSPAMELYAATVTSSLSNQFYESADDRVKRIRTLIRQNDPLFVAKLAVYAREVMHLRSMPLVLTVELGLQHSGNSLVGDLAARVVQRADEITELLSYFSLANGRVELKKLNKLSKQLQKGLARAFNKFDEYQFAKYNRDAAIKLKDVLFLVHPKPKDEAQQELFDRIVRDNLAMPYTWETTLSAVGQVKYESPELKKAAIRKEWEQLIFSGKLGYMATLRNLRNMLEAGIEGEALNHVCAFLADANAVARSKQLPFRFLSAYLELKEISEGLSGKVLDALEAAVAASAVNIAGFDEKTSVVIGADVSGSMQRAISMKSKVQNFDIGLMLAMLLKSRCGNAVTGMFGNTWKVINVPGKSILANVQEFRKREGEVGYSTNGYLVVKDLLSRKKVVDKVMLFTDCQLWNSTGSGEQIADLWARYKVLAPAAKLYLFDLNGFSKMPLEMLKADVFLISGWSDKVFDVLAAIEEGSSAIEVIDRIVL